MRKYRTVSRRRLGSSDLLKKIDGYYEDVEKLGKRSSSALSNLYDENYEDAKYREDCLANAGQIYDAYCEGSSLAGMEFDWSNPASKWITINNYNLKNYTKDVREIRDLQNNLYTSSYKDLGRIWGMFRTYLSDRDRNWLSNSSEIYDDSYIRQRHIFQYKSKKVMEDASLSKSWGSYKLKKSYTNVTEIEKEYDTEPEPTLPSASQFKGLVSYGTGINNARYYANKIVGLNLTGGTDETWYKYVHFNSDLIKNASILDVVVYDDKKTSSFADTVIEKLKENIFLMSSDQQSYCTCEVITKKKFIYKIGKLYSQYEDYYSASTNDVKEWVYDRYNSVYDDNEYAVKLRLFIDGRYINKDSTDLIMTENMTSTAAIKLVTDFSNKLKNYLVNARNNYLNSDSDTRNEDYEPEKTYTEYYNKFCSSKIYTTVDGCKMVQGYCRSLITWIDQRKKSLMEQTTDETTINNLLNALELRLNKNTGTIMMWYQNLVSIDSEFKNIVRKKNNVIQNMKSMLVTRAIDESDASTFAHQVNPNYIDIEDPDGLYSSYNYSFKKGDIIYIEDDSHTEIKTRITNISNITIKTTNYNDLDISSLNSGNLDGELSKNKTVKRLFLSTRLPYYYCNDNDVSSLRVLKLI